MKMVVDSVLIGKFSVREAVTQLLEKKLKNDHERFPMYIFLKALLYLRHIGFIPHENYARI